MAGAVETAIPVTRERHDDVVAERDDDMPVVAGFSPPGDRWLCPIPRARLGLAHVGA